MSFLLKKLAIITTHPIQYNAPWFKLIAQRGNLLIRVFYTWSQTQTDAKFDPGFGKKIEWDLPLLEGYDYQFVKNTSPHPGSKHFGGIQNPSLVSEVTKWAPNAILVFGWKFKSHLKILRHFKDKVLILFRGDSHLLGRETGMVNYFRRRILRYVFAHVDYSLYVGKLNKQYFLSAGMNNEQLLYCPHTIDTDRFKPAFALFEEARNIRTKLNISPDHFVFLFAGKFEGVKNPLLLIEASRKIKNERVHFVFAGNGELESKIREMAGRNVHFLSFQNQSKMPALYCMADIYVLPSHSETWGLAVNEAMSCGIPALVSDKCGCIPDLIQDGYSGFIFRENNLNDLTKKILHIINRKDSLDEMKAVVKRLARSASLENNSIVLENLINSVA